MGADEILGDLFFVEMDHRSDDMARSIVSDLDDVLAEIGLGHLDAGGLEMGVEPDLLRHHRLSLGDEAAASVLADLENDVACVGRARGEMHATSALHDLPLIGFEIEVEKEKRMVLERARLIAQPIEFRQLLLGVRALDDEAAFDVLKRSLQLGVGKRPLSTLFEG